ncbi:MAG TPA: hypothetical protein VGD65_24505 [Chryseosolibacter sp.]
MLQKSITERQLLALELLIAFVFCFVPLLFNNPYRINIFLSWEGAYRMSIGQMPFRDYSLPMGYGYWVIPAIFFKLFGPYFASLIKAQVFINFLSVLALRGILKTLNVKPVVIFFSVVVFCFSYVSFNFWPWYNHVVFVFEIIGFYFILRAILVSTGWKTWLNIVLGAFFMFFSLWTKQDIGGLGLLIALGILTYNAWVDRDVKKLGAFVAAYAFFAAAFILPLLKYDFGYWFNHGQYPHKSRLVLMDFLNEILGWAYFEKFFLLIIVLFVIDKATKGREFFYDKREVIFALLCIGIIFQAFIIPVTSPVPERNEVFFYAFGFAYCFANLRLTVDLSRWGYLAVCMVFVVFWWTGIYWRNVQRIISKKPEVVKSNEQAGQHKYRLAKEYKSMEKLFLAENTLDGIRKIMELDVVKNTPKEKIKVLNMSELTSLAYEMGYTPLTNQPMWFHQTVSIFEKEVEWFCGKVKDNEYDLVIFESVSPKEVLNFYPEDVHRCLDEHYQFEFSFLAPRHPEESFVYVYTKRPAGITRGETKKSGCPNH